MACERYEVGIRDTRRGTMILRTWTAAEVEHAVPWLRLMNARDHDIYVRPLGSVGLILADDLTEAAIAQMTRDGLAPAVVVETSTANFQAWVRVSETPIAQELATAAARILAERYHGDPRAADWRHFGRLAGFTNRKRQHERAGRQPYVLLHAARGGLAEHGAQVLQDAAERLRAPIVTTAAPVPIGQPLPGTPADAYRAIAEPLMARYGAPTDPSRLDWTVCKRLALSDPAVDQAYLEQALLGGSPALHERKRGHEVDYARRTAAKVLRDPGVVAMRSHLGGEVIS